MEVFIVGCLVCLALFALPLMGAGGSGYVRQPIPPREKDKI